MGGTEVAEVHPTVLLHVDEMDGQGNHLSRQSMEMTLDPISICLIVGGIVLAIATVAVKAYAAKIRREFNMWVEKLAKQVRDDVKANINRFLKVMKDLKKSQKEMAAALHKI